MKKEFIYCDGCGHAFSGKESWEEAPVSVALKLSHPRQTYESTELNHVCWACVEKLKLGFHNALLECRAKRPTNHDHNT